MDPLPHLIRPHKYQMPLTDDLEALGLLLISVPCGVVLCLTVVAYDSLIWRIEELRLKLAESAFFPIALYEYGTRTGTVHTFQYKP